MPAPTFGRLRKLLAFQRGHSFGNAAPGVYTPMPATHSESFSLIDSISVGADRVSWNFEPVRKQVEAWQRCKLADVTGTPTLADEATLKLCKLGREQRLAKRRRRVDVFLI